jgi:Methyltransferase domain
MARLIPGIFYAPSLSVLCIDRYRERHGHLLTMRAPTFSPRIWSRTMLASKAAAAISGGEHFISLMYPPSAQDAPRYGYGRPSHQRLSELLGRHDREYLEVLRGFESYVDELRAIPLRETSRSEPHWWNGLLFGLDGVSLYGFIRNRAPRRYVEVGSGNSTLFADRARRDGDVAMEIVSIDPCPCREIDAICDSIVRAPLERADLEIFRGLHDGDIVFLDGTHRVFMNSDVTVFFLDVLPELAPGVLVGIHDIHLPDDYRPEHAYRYYSEQYLLAVQLLSEPSWLRVVLPCWYVSHHPEFAALVRALVPRTDSQEDSHGVIFWLLTKPRP